MRETLLIEPHYAGSLEYFTLLKHYKNVRWEVCDSFKKQTYRNRTYVLGSNRVLLLSVPLVFSNRTITKDVRVDYAQRWTKDHWRAVRSSYGKAPFFEYFADEFEAVWEEKHKFLIDLNDKLLQLCLQVLSIKVNSEFTNSFEEEAIDCDDFRNIIQPKVLFSDRKIYQPFTYSQLFGDSFVPNLSIIDLIMCEGPRAREVLAKSYRGEK